jgi:hypothetical protein
MVGSDIDIGVTISLHAVNSVTVLGSHDPNKIQGDINYGWSNDFSID